MAKDYASQFEQARKNYREQLDTYRSSHKEEDLVKANEAYQAWLKHQQDFRQGCFWRYASCRVASPWSRTPKMMSPSEILPPELDLEDMRVKKFE